MSFNFIFFFVYYSTQVNLKVDSSQCQSSQCLDTNTAAQFLAQSLRRGFKSQLPIYSVQGKVHTIQITLTSVRF